MKLASLAAAWLGGLALAYRWYDADPGPTLLLAVAALVLALILRLARLDRQLPRQLPANCPVNAPINRSVNRPSIAPSIAPSTSSATTSPADQLDSIPLARPAVGPALPGLVAV